MQCFWGLRARRVISSVSCPTPRLPQRRLNTSHGISSALSGLRSTAAMLTVTTASDSAQASRRKMPSALTFDLHAKCSVRFSLPSPYTCTTSLCLGPSTAKTLTITSNVFPKYKDHKSPRQYTPSPPRSRPTPNLHACRDTSLAQRLDS